MKGFASNLISRHMHTEGNIIPRLRGRFEAEQNSFREDVNPAPVNSVDTFSERTNADERQGPDADTETSTYRPVINTTRRDSGIMQQPNPQPEPESPAQVSFSAAKAAFKRPATFEVGPIGDDFDPGNKENTTRNEPVSPGKRQNAMPYQHNFNTNTPSNPVNSSDGRLVWPKRDMPEADRKTALFAGKRKSGAAPESIGVKDGPTSVRVNEGVQPATEFKSFNTGMQNGINTVTPQSTGNGNLRDGGQKPLQQTAQPVIKVTIGRIEVKAVHPQAPAALQRREPQKPMLTLDDFLSQHKRNGQ
ncbi:MAG: hypothetical protein ABJA76_17410 [Mucilaginibacter sp.]